MLFYCLHGSYTLYGLVGTVDFIGYLLGVLMPWLLARFANCVRLNTVALPAMSRMMLASALSRNLWQLGLWRLLIGLPSAIATVLTMALTLEHIRQEERGLASGFVWMGGALGILHSGLIVPPFPVREPRWDGNSSGASWASLEVSQRWAFIALAG
jgi:MFS family permease